MPQPVRSAPRFPAEYGEPSKEAGQLPTEWLEERLSKAKNYWLSTTRPDGRPHARPVDGVWVDGALCFGGAEATRWARNLRNDPALTVSLGGEDEALILEGDVEWVEDPEHLLAGPSQQASRDKYPQYYPRGNAPLPFRPFFALRPRVAYGWILETFPASTTKWVWPDED
jgi:hypothetical protein